jgi:hypothetical protein
MNGKAKLVWGLLGLAVVVGLPLAGHWARRHARSGCALDGLPIKADYQVDVEDSQGRTWSFCCLRCADLWLRQQKEAPRAILVTDEASGARIDARDAYFVRSMIVTMPPTGNRIHVFRTEVDARRHAEESFGTVLVGSERPFATLLAP